jgi:polyphosphate kinase
MAGRYMAGKEKKSKSDSKSNNRRESENIYINRELSWMAFNLRVLQEAADTSVPLLERLKFLMIYQSNLEEFYRVRIGILTHRAMLTPDKRETVSGMLPETEIDEILRVTREQQIMMESVWKAVREELHINKIDVLDFRKISKVDELMSKKLFGDIRKLLDPRIINIEQPLPFRTHLTEKTLHRHGEGVFCQRVGADDVLVHEFDLLC